MIPLIASRAHEYMKLNTVYTKSSGEPIHAEKGLANFLRSLSLILSPNDADEIVEWANSEGKDFFKSAGDREMTKQEITEKVDELFEAAQKRVTADKMTKALSKLFQDAKNERREMLNTFEKLFRGKITSEDDCRVTYKEFKEKMCDESSGIVGKLPTREYWKQTPEVRKNEVPKDDATLDLRKVLDTMFKDCVSTVDLLNPCIATPASYYRIADPSPGACACATHEEAQDLEWLKTEKGGSIPATAVVSGFQIKGCGMKLFKQNKKQFLAVARASGPKGFLSGKIVMNDAEEIGESHDLTSASMSEFSASETDYQKRDRAEILCCKHREQIEYREVTPGDEVPSGAIVGGEFEGKKLYVARANGPGFFVLEDQVTGEGGYVLEDDDGRCGKFFGELVGGSTGSNLLCEILVYKGP